MTDLPSGSELETEILNMRSARPGTENRRAYVGPPAQYDFMGATQFRLITALGLTEDHHVLDIGCGSLRAGRFLIPYLLPGRYTGVEPNDWLWREAFEQEIGLDLMRLRAPTFESESDFTLSFAEPDSFDVVVAQSIYSHTGHDLLETSLTAIASRLKPDGQALFTIITADRPGAGSMAEGRSTRGWVYPECVTYDEDHLDAVCGRAGLFVQRLAWFHPRQIWFRATRDPALRLTSQMMADLGTGRPLFDPRFCHRKPIPGDPGSRRGT